MHPQNKSSGVHMLFQTIQTGEPLFWQGLVFSAIAAGITLFAIWWLYFSNVKPLKQPIRADVSPKLLTRIALIIGFSGLIRYTGSIWDISEHIITGVVPGGEDFLWPPHQIIYFSFFLSLSVALYSILMVSKPYRQKRIFDPRYAIREQPFLGAVVVAGLYAWMSVPGDALWHELYGFELTSWSPPHVMLIIASAAETLSAAALLIKSAEQKSHPLWKTILSILIFSVALNEIYIIATTDWEGSVTSGISLDIISRRPIWIFPVVAAGCAIFVFQLARQLTGQRFAGTLTAVGFYLIRFAGMGWITSMDGFPLKFPLIFLAGIFLIEWIDWTKVENRTLALISQSALFSAGFYALSFPILERLKPVFTITWMDYLTGFVVLTIVSAILILGAERCSIWFSTGGTVTPTLRPAQKVAAGD